MAYRFKLSRAIAVPLLPIFLMFPVYAHKTEVSGDIAATWHIEPDDHPGAGESAQVWIALTRKGGEIIPLEQCNCQLKIWAGSKNTAPLLEPALKPISAEQYQGIPGAEVIFPNLGKYELQLSGTPKPGANFQAFQFNHSMLVATGTDVSTVASLEATANQDNTTVKVTDLSAPQLTPSGSQGIAGIVLAIVIVIGMLGLITNRLRSGK